MANTPKRPPWTDKYKQNWDESYKRVMAWWNFEDTDRPVLLNSYTKPVEERDSNLKWIGGADPDEKRRIDIDLSVKMNNLRCVTENNRFIGDGVPGKNYSFGSDLGLLCVQAGGTISYGNGTAWLNHEPDLYSREIPDIASDCNVLDRIGEYIRKAHETYGYDIVLGANPMIDPLTTLSMMRGAAELNLDLVDDPDTVERWVKALGDHYMKAAEFYRSVRAELGRREDLNWCGMWAPGDMDALQCDFSTMISPEMFRRFALPEAEREAAFYDYSLWHLDGDDEFRHLDDILAIPGLNGIQYVENKGKDPLEHMEIWEKIIGRKKCLTMWASKESALEMTKHLGKKGLAFHIAGLQSEDAFYDYAKILERL
ncbi:hypothetical protein FACS1894219_08710 [Clostridia bacterium]|nr:hypothetical protein FACS1894219_08710 [Clostridia bacterium]